MAGRVTFHGAWLRIVCASLLVVLGFAHNPVEARASVPVDMTAYMLPDGTFADLCIGDHVGGKSEGHRVASDCEACRLSTGGLLPLPPTAAIVIPRIEMAAIVIVDKIARRAVIRLGGPSPRGPPQAV